MAVPGSIPRPVARGVSRMVVSSLYAAGAGSGASTLLDGETQGLALDFTDDWFYATTGFYGSARVKDAGTPANNYNTTPDKTASSFLTYTSPSPKMCMGPSGTLRFGAHNLRTYSEQLDDAAWTKTALTGVTANQITAPDGTLTGDLITENTATTTHEIKSANATVVVGNTYEAKIYVKAGTALYASVYVTDATAHNYPWLVNLTTGTGQKHSGIFNYNSNFTGSSTLRADGWIEVTIAFTQLTGSTTSSINIAFTADDGNPATNFIAVVGTSRTVYAWGAQLRRTPSDSTYLATTTAARYALPLEWGPQLASGLATQSVTVAVSTAATPRRYSVYFEGSGSVTMSGAASGALTASTPSTIEPTTTTLTLTVSGSVTKLYVGEDLGLRVEEARTNTVLYSNTFTNAAWVVTNLTKSTGTDVDPFGATPFKLVEDSGTTIKAMHQQVGLTGAQTISWMVKATGTSRYFAARSWVAANNFHTVIFDLSSGAVTQSTSGSSFGGSGVSSGSVNLGNGWYRVWLSLTTVGATQYQSLFLADSGTPSIDSNGQPAAYLGDGASGVLLAQKDFQAGAFLTSPIPTVASTVTRAADSIRLAGTTFPYDATALTAFVQFKGELVPMAGNHILDFGASGTTDLEIYVNINYEVGYFLNSAEINEQVGGAVSANVACKASLAVATNDAQWVTNGVSQGTDSSCAPPAAASANVWFGRYTAAATFELNGYIQRVMLVPRRMSGAEMITLTT